jgi:hypothetical protein
VVAAEGVIMFYIGCVAEHYCWQFGAEVADLSYFQIVRVVVCGEY